MKTCIYCCEKINATDGRNICPKCADKLPVMKQLQKQLDQLRVLKRKRDERRYLGKI